MKLDEFKAWFEGFTEGMDSTPSEKQWKRIKEQVAAIDGVPVTPVYVERYWPRYLNVPPYQPYWGTISSCHISSLQQAGQNANLSAAVSGQISPSFEGIATNHGGFDSHSAMYALGKAEAIQ